jgi:type I restriction-modification system DNA methylase subunit
MNVKFKSAQQETLFKAVLRNLQRLGFRDELLQQDYTFIDWFEPDNPERVVPAAAFGQTPQSYDSACFAVLLSNGNFGPPLVGECRALGAPYAFEIRDDVIVNWRVGRDPNGSKELLRISPDALDRTFEDKQESWTGADVLRTKGISFRLGPRQLDFIDLGLIPAIEQQVSLKLDRILQEVVRDAVSLLQRSQQNNPDALRGVYRLIFRFLAGKVLHDRAVTPFSNFDEHTARAVILDEVAKYYGEQPAVPSDPALRDLVSSSIWTQLDFRNLSVEVLAYIYENTFVGEEARQKLGTHGTPHAVARYLVHQIPFEQFAESERYTLEPFCGHGVFLVAALQRLRELLPPGMEAKERHKYFVRMLRGFEIDRFALEVSRLCLMLADFPNHNGWKLNEEDIFAPDAFSTAVKQSRIVLSNPPFEDFTELERRRYPTLSSPHKPVELLNHILNKLPANGVLGIVLPSRFLDGSAYHKTRAELARRFQSLKLVSLPDGVFEKSDMETVLVIGTEPRTDQSKKLRVSFTHVAEKDRDAFLRQYEVTRRDEAERTEEEASRSLNIVCLREVWEKFYHLEPLGQFAEIHKGVEWTPSPDPNRYVSASPRQGFRRGVYNAQNLLAFEKPETKYLCFDPKYRRPRAPGGFDLPWVEKKVFVNAARVSRGPWRIVAFSDASGLISNKRFHALWPRKPWTVVSLAGILNSPIANAYVAAHDFARDIRKQTLEAIPLPRWGVEEILTLERLVAEYMRTDKAEPRAARDALLAIDAFILKGYGLPPRLERELLDLFKRVKRPAPFEFNGYFPDEFTSNIPLWMFLSPEYRKCNANYLLSRIPIITDPALIEALEEVAE